VATHDAAGDEHDYYLIGWNPDDKAFDLEGTQPRYHSLDIRARRPGMNGYIPSAFSGCTRTI
jgi:hypothetical protein